MENYESLYKQFVDKFGKNQLSKVKEKWMNEINPDDVFNSIDGDELNDTFWAQHGANVDRYKQLILNYTTAKEYVKKNGSIDSRDSSDPIRIAYEMFHGGDHIRLLEFDGRLLIEGNGRHRIAAAKLLKKEGVPVTLTALVTYYGPNIPHANNQSNHRSTKFTNDMAGYQLERQIDLLSEAKKLFSEHSELIQALMENFNKSVTSLEQDDLNHDYVTFIEQFLLEYTGRLKSIRVTIDDEYLPQIERKKRHLEERV